MAPESESNLRLKIGHVLFIDLVGYSQLLIEEQKNRQRQLTDILLATAQVVRATNEELVRLPTGDGMALVFWNSSEEPAQCALEVARALKDHPALAVRMGIHSGPVSEVTDMNGRTNIAGAGINMAQRVMDCGDAGHILLSKHVADDLENYVRWQPHLYDLGDAEVKHGVQVHLVSLYGDGFGRSELPAKLRQTEQARVARTRRKRRWQFISAAFFFALLFGVGLWFYLHLVARTQQITTAAVPEKSIAVLPFENLSDQKENAYFTNGVQEEIRNNLAKVPDLKVTSRTSAMQYDGRTRPNLRQIAQELGVAHVLEGTVQRVGDDVRVSADLIDARSDTHLWADHYDREIHDLFALESEVAEIIVAQLKAKLSPEIKAAIEDRPTSDLTAYDLYTRANDLIALSTFNVGGTDNLLEAASLLEKATALDPNFFLAYCRLARVHDQIYLAATDHTPARLALADAALKTALRLRPDAGETHLALADHLYCGYLDFDRAREELKIAERLLPNNSLVFELAGYIDRRQSRWDESTRNLLRALDLDPRGLGILQQLALSYQYLRRFADAATIIDRTIAIAPNDVGQRVTRAVLDLNWLANPEPLQKRIESTVAKNPEAVPGLADQWLFLALCQRDPGGARKAVAALPGTGYSSEGFLYPLSWCKALAAKAAGDSETARSNFIAARAEVERGLQDQPDYGESLALLGMIDAALGHKEEAIHEGRRAVALLPLDKDSINGAFAIEYLAVIYAWTGEIDQALEQLKAATAIPSDVTYGQLRLHPFWDALRGDPRFDQIVASLAPAGKP